MTGEAALAVGGGLAVAILLVWRVLRRSPRQAPRPGDRLADEALALAGQVICEVLVDDLDQIDEAAADARSAARLATQLRGRR